MNRNFVIFASFLALLVSAPSQALQGKQQTSNEQPSLVAKIIAAEKEFETLEASGEARDAVEEQLLRLREEHQVLLDQRDRMLSTLLEKGQIKFKRMNSFPEQNQQVEEQRESSERERIKLEQLVDQTVGKEQEQALAKLHSIQIVCDELARLNLIVKSIGLPKNVLEESAYGRQLSWKIEESRAELEQVQSMILEAEKSKGKDQVQELVERRELLINRLDKLKEKQEKLEQEAKGKEK